MKRLFIAALILAAFASCKKNSSAAPVTIISASDISKSFGAGIATTFAGINVTASNLSTPAQGNNQSWNFSGIVFSNSLNTTNYTSASSPFPSDAFEWTGKFASLIQGDSTTQSNVFDITDSGFCNLGAVITQETFNIPGLGTVAYPAQTSTNSQRLPETPMLPFMYGDSVAFSNNISTENFTANAPSVGLVNTPGQEQFISSGSASCWAAGTITLPGFASPLNVLVVKLQIKHITNYFLGGQPAPAQLLSMLGLTNGAITYENSYDFYSPGIGELGTIHVDGNNNITSAGFRQQ